MTTDADRKDLDQLADFVLGTLRSGKIDIAGAWGVGAPLKRQAGKLGPATGHMLRRYCREDPQASALLGLAAQQSPAVAKLLERLGLQPKDVEAEVKPDAKPEAKA